MSKIAQRRFGWPLTENQKKDTAWIQPLVEGDILHIQVGLTADEVGGGSAWIPQPQDLAEAYEYWTAIAPEGVIVAVTHLGEKATVVRP